MATAAGRRGTHMKRARLIAFIAFTLAATVSAATVHAARGHRSAVREAPSAVRCGGPLWRMKTLSDVGRNSVKLAPRPTTIGAIQQRGMPRPTPARRKTPFQRQVWQVPAQITRYWIDVTALRLQLWDHGSYMNAVVPAPFCLSSKTRARAAIVRVWNLFTGNCGRPTHFVQPLGAVVTLTGVGFWSQHRSRHGEARNGAELQPVTGLRPVAGCGN
jgi:hypothetical protein